MVNGNGGSNIVKLITSVGVPATILLLVLWAVDRRILAPVGEAHVENIKAQTETLGKVSEGIGNILTVVRTDAAERKAEKIENMRELLTNHDSCTMEQLKKNAKTLEKQTDILEKLSDVMDRLEKNRE